MGLLETVKKSLLIPVEETYADEELNSYIEASKRLLISAGIKEEIIVEHPLAHSLVIIYCKTFFGFKSDGSVKELPKSFDMLFTQLVLSHGESDVSK